MMRAIEAIIDEVGTVRLKERVHLRRSCRAIVTILDEEADLEMALLSEASAKSREKVTSSEDQLVLGNVEKFSSYFWIGTSLAVDWDRPEEDEAWSHLQRLGNDPTFTFPSKEGGEFSEVRPVQGKGIAASHLLTRDRR